MKKVEHLNEEKYQKTSKKMFWIGIGIMLLGVIITIIILIPKLKPQKNEEELKKQLADLKPALEERYAELEGKGVEESWDYKNKEGYEMFLIDTALDPYYEKCENSSRYTDNDTTREYCKVKAELYNLNDSFANGRIMFTLVPALMFLLPCLAIGGMIVMISKRREITAFTAQQIMPVAQEGIEKMTPTIGSAAGTIGKEIAKGIKEGLKEDEENN